MVTHAPAFAFVRGSPTERPTLGWLIDWLSLQVACRRGSPLILGVKEAESEEEGVIIEHEINGNCSSPTTSQTYPRANAFSELFLASDASAVVEHTKSVIFLEDDDVVHLRRGLFSCYKFPKEKVGERPRARARALLALFDASRNDHGAYWYCDRPRRAAASAIAKAMEPRRFHWAKRSTEPSTSSKWRWSK